MLTDTQSATRRTQRRRAPRRRAQRRPTRAPARRSSSCATHRRSTPAATSGSSASRSAVDRGEFVFLVGPTGCGKSTLIKLLIRELEPAERRGPDRRPRHRRRSPTSSVPYLRRRIGTVFQDFKLLPNRTVYDNVAYALQVIGAPRSRDPQQGPRDPAPRRPRRRRSTTTPTSSPAASSSASRSPARSSTTRRCCSPTSRPATSTP